jgi:hypothetical protein
LDRRSDNMTFRDVEKKRCEKFKPIQSRGTSSR